MTPIELAIADIGYTESPPNSNKTKYGKAYGMDGQPWCMMAVQEWYKDSGHPLPLKTASCSSFLNWVKKNMPEAITDKPQPSDIIIYNFGHCGLVEAIDGSAVVAIEGNTSVSGSQNNGGMVCRKRRNIANKVTAFIHVYDFNEEDDIMTGEQINKELTTYTDALPESAWSAKEGAMEKAKRLGITDGSAPRSALTREQLFAILDRLGLLK